MLFYKDTAETFAYSFQYELATGETITTSTWSVLPTGLTLSSPSFTANTATVRLAGGTTGVDYKITNVIITNVANQDVQVATVRIGTEIVSAAGLLRSVPGGESYDLQDARETVEGWIGRVKAAQGGVFVDEPFARSVVRKGAKAEIWGEVLRQSGHLAAGETTSEEDKVEKLLKEFDAAVATPNEKNQRVTTRATLRG